MLIVTSDRGLAGALHARRSSRRASSSPASLREQGVDRRSVPGRAQGVSATTASAAVTVASSWTGFTDQPDYEPRQGDRRRRCSRRSSSPPRRAASTRSTSSTPHFESMVTQTAAGSPGASASRSSSRRPRRLRPQARARSRCTSSSPSAAAVLDSLLPKYVENVVYTALLDRCGLGARRPSPRHEGRDRQRRGAHQDPHPPGEPGPPGRDHPGDQRDRRRRRRAVAHRHRSEDDHDCND